MNNNITYFIADEHLQIAHKIAKFLVQEQQRIEPGKEGISTELSKLITYLDSKIKQNLNVDKKERKPSRFFTYIEQLAEHGKTIGHSKKTTSYYESINEICNQYLRVYEKKPLVIIQILGWSQRLIRCHSLIIQAIIYTSCWFNQTSSSPTSEKSNNASPKVSSCSIDNPLTRSINNGLISRKRLFSWRIIRRCSPCLFPCSRISW